MKLNHGSDECRDIAEHGTILRTLVGSSAHGLSVNDQDDRDEMGICVEPPAYITGLRRFEQFEYRSAAIREGKRDVRSGPGDLDLVIYSLRKWMRLAVAGNPTVLIPLFAPPESTIIRTRTGSWVIEARDHILSDNAGERYLGYLRAQRHLLETRGHGSGAKRPELVDRYGFDTKFAGHMVRLGLQGAELLETGKITLPVPEPWRSAIIELRTGGISKQDALDQTHSFELKIERLLKSGSVLHPHPDHDMVDELLNNIYKEAWGYGRR